VKKRSIDRSLCPSICSIAQQIYQAVSMFSSSSKSQAAAPPVPLPWVEK